MSDRNSRPRYLQSFSLLTFSTGFAGAGRAREPTESIKRKVTCTRSHQPTLKASGLQTAAICTPESQPSAWVSNTVLLVAVSKLLICFHFKTCFSLTFLDTVYCHVICPIKEILTYQLCKLCTSHHILQKMCHLFAFPKKQSNITEK